MHVLIIGAAGMIGRKLAERIISDTALSGQTVTHLTLADVHLPSDMLATDMQVTTTQADLSRAGVASQLISGKPELIYHLAAIVSGEAEQDMDKGYRINLDGTRELLESIKTAHEENGYTPKVVFTSSIAVYGAPFPASIDDEFHSTPLTSADYHRRGIIMGIGLRLPTICIRPGKPNAAASGFFSGILREPINGQKAILPVADTVRHWFASPRAAIGFLIHAAGLTREQIGFRCNMNLPGLCATVADQIDSLRRIVGSDAVALIETKPDPTINAIVAGWPESFTPTRASALGFVAESSFDEIIQVYLDDELGA